MIYCLNCGIVHNAWHEDGSCSKCGYLPKGLVSLHMELDEFCARMSVAEGLRVAYIYVRPGAESETQRMAVAMFEQTFRCGETFWAEELSLEEGAYENGTVGQLVALAYKLKRFVGINTISNQWAFIKDPNIPEDDIALAG